jgi:hypothetical protein
MIRLTKFARRRLVVLVTFIVVLSSALDGCLLDCHARQRDLDVQAAAYTHCHPAPAQQVVTPSVEVGAGRWQTDRTCHHDHTSAAAESTARNRLDSRELGVLASFVLRPDRPVTATPPVIRSIDNRSTPAADFIPLRV